MDRFVHSLVEACERGGLPRAAVPGRRRGPGRRLRRPAALDRRGRLRRHRHLPRQPAGRLAEPAAGAVRRLRPALGRRRGRATRGSTSTAPPASRSPPSTSSTAATPRIAWIGWRKDSPIGEDRRAGWARDDAQDGLSTTGLASRVEDTVASGAEAAAVLLDEAAADGVRLRVRHPRDGRPAHALDRARLAPGRDIAVVGFDDSQVAQVSRWASRPYASRWRTWRSRSSGTLRGAARPTSPSRRAGVLLEPTLGDPRVELTPAQKWRHQRLTA